MNTLQLVNSVLRRVRETEVTDFSESYTKLILDFINETKREVEDSWDWSMLRNTLTITTNTTDQDYSLVGAGQRYRLINAFNTTNKYELQITEPSEILREQQVYSTSSLVPQVFAITGQDSNLDPIVSFGAPPNGVYPLKFNLVIPQDELVNTTDAIKVPWYPVVQGAWARAISERGEDGGQNTSEQYQMYVTSLSDAIAQDAGRVGEITWTSV